MVYPVRNVDQSLLDLLVMETGLSVKVPNVDTCSGKMGIGILASQGVLTEHKVKLHQLKGDTFVEGN
jgi:hypothetical protein